MPKIDLKLDDIPAATLLSVNAEGTDVVVYRVNGTIRAFIDRCPHAHWPLSQGEVKDGVLLCVGHGWKFDLATGECITVPVCSLKPLPTLIHDDRIRIEWD